MSFKKEIEQYLEQISVLEESFRKVKDLDPLPVSFFSASLDILNQLETGLYELESSQLQRIATVNSTSSLIVGKSSTILVVAEPVNEPAGKPVDEPVESGLPGNKISKKIYADLTKSLTINLRFMFLRDLFKGNDAEMNRTLAHLNALQTLEEALAYLNGNHPVSWETESGIAFREWLEKHFT
ncbi:MAG: hypothetical protein LBG45_08045 [Dysgonamonadaceae bacterium]|jgi:hypothetical protein|nr:hypothetical protein [Dysgonamonadaceae bacterium]